MSAKSKSRTSMFYRLPRIDPDIYPMAEGGPDLFTKMKDPEKYQEWGKLHYDDGVDAHEAFQIVYGGEK